ncbi:glutathione S-transferase family protein [Shewanella sedimentimangrovi]|uniref:Glutathione S-transferase family protein n=1 Tax=Shewanella sedimentimangrovi TaxID=2814293 RepID=A0ABX7QXL2_9GAMM|nr:glutathione S-transferase family protein [Shewanella sedimentimangrovi]QSX36256.1 glutathione S-transferase family protein [Shewanella sedimentimangrovi]
MLKLYGSPNTRTIRALWTLEETGLPYDYVRLDFEGGEHQKPPYLEINPNAKVPSLEVDGQVLLETNAICRYIAEQAPDAGLIPDSALERAQMNQWCDFQLSELEPPPWMMIKNLRVYPDAVKLDNQALLAAMNCEADRAMGILAKGIKASGYVLESGFSLADIQLAVTLMTYLKAKMSIKEPKVLDYLKRCCDRPAIAKLQAMGDLSRFNL